VLDSGALKHLLLDLLADSPIVRELVIADVLLLVKVGEEHLAFDTMCSWLFEDDLVINRAYYDRLLAAAEVLHALESIRRLDELILE
jgi:hypothetical protein